MSIGNAQHELQNEDDGLHSPFFATYADTASRLSDTRTTGPRLIPGNPASPFRPLIAEDVNKFALQLNDRSIWMLTSTAPTWDQLFVGADSSSVVDVSIRKQTAGTINPGTAVYVSGYDNVNKIVLVELARADSEMTMPALGIVSDTATDAVTGKVRLVGELDNIDTSAFTAQDELYVSASVAGALTNVRPTGATHLIQKSAVVAYSDATEGVLNIKGAIRANGLPNLSVGKIWVGNSDSLPVETNLPVSPPTVLPALSLLSTVGTGWAVNATAPLIADPLNTAILVRAFDDTATEGVGFTISIPTGSLNLVLTLISRARSAPGGAVVAKTSFYHKEIAIAGAVPAWSSSNAMDDVSLGTNTNFVTTTTTTSLATLGMVAGRRYICEIVRTSTGNTLVGDLCVESVSVSFT